MPGSFQGIDPGSSLSGTQARSQLEGALGRSLTDTEIASTGYNDPTGQRSVSGTDFNRFMQQAGGANYTPWTAPTTSGGGTTGTGATGPLAGATTSGTGGVGSTTSGSGGVARNIWHGVDPASTQTGLQAKTLLEQQLGRPLTAEEQQWIQTTTGYNDPTGAAPLSGANWNLLMQEAARRGGGTYNAWTAPAATSPGGATVTTGLNTTPAPGYTAPRPNLPTYTAPDKFGGLTWEQAMAQDPGIAARLGRGQQALEHSAAARGMLHSPNTMAGLIDYNQQAAGDEYANAYNRAFGQWEAGYGVDTDTYGRNYQRALDEYNANLAGSQLEYAPGLLTWQQQNRLGELGFDRSWQQYVYGADDAYRRETRDQNRYDLRDFYQRDDEWRRLQMEEDRRRFLAQLGIT